MARFQIHCLRAPAITTLAAIHLRDRFTSLSSYSSLHARTWWSVRTLRNELPTSLARSPTFISFPRSCATFFLLQIVVVPVSLLLRPIFRFRWNFAFLIHTSNSKLSFSLRHNGISYITVASGSAISHARVRRL